MDDPEVRDPYAPPPEGAVPRERPEPPRPTAPPGEPEPSGRRAIWWTLAGAVMLVPLAPLAFVLCVVAVIIGVRALRRAGARGVKAPGALGSVITASVIGLLALGLTAFLAIFLPELREYQECTSGANTHIAQERCEQQLRDAISRKAGIDL